jgi:anhydro-N-acetylmuramic acid kinase
VASTKERPLLVLGIMSGTSIDAVDYALCEVTLTRVRLLSHWQVKFPTRLRQRLHAVASDEASSYEVGQLQHDLGRFYAKHSACDPRPDLVGLHGQTAFHNPNRNAPATLQLGEASYLVEMLRVPVVDNFRAADIATGGQGAPLATLFHRVVFAKTGRHLCVNNLGGISNVTSIDWSRGQRPKLLAFDTSPANVLLDLAIRHFTAGRKSFDEGGAWAARGKVEEKVLTSWLKHSFFRQRPPKSTGREVFGEPLFEQVLRQTAKLSRYNTLATLTEFTARSLALNYELHLGTVPDEVILCGGGAANGYLVSRIRANLQALAPATEIATCAELGWPPQSVEPAAFALLAYCRWMRKPGNIPETTGAKHAVLLGQIAEG